MESRSRLSKETKATIQFILSGIVVLAGFVLVYLGFFEIPVGEIHPSVLTAFGEALGFGGVGLGMDTHYKIKALEKDESKTE